MYIAKDCQRHHTLCFNNETYIKHLHTVLIPLSLPEMTVAIRTTVVPIRILIRTIYGCFATLPVRAWFFRYLSLDHSVTRRFGTKPFRPLDVSAPRPFGPRRFGPRPRPYCQHRQHFERQL